MRFINSRLGTARVKKIKVTGFRAFSRPTAFSHHIVIVHVSGTTTLAMQKKSRVRAEERRKNGLPRPHRLSTRELTDDKNR